MSIGGRSGSHVTQGHNGCRSASGDHGKGSSRVGWSAALPPTPKSACGAVQKIKEPRLDLIGSRILVVGGAGLIGSHVVEQLLEEDVNEVVVYDNFCRGTPENLRPALGDPR